MENNYEGVIEILRYVRNIVDQEDTDVIWSSYNTVKELLNELDTYIDKLKFKDSTVIEEIKILFAPTGDLQEISISNGWENKFLIYSGRIDNLISSFK